MPCVCQNDRSECGQGPHHHSTSWKCTARQAAHSIAKSANGLAPPPASIPTPRIRAKTIQYTAGLPPSITRVGPIFHRSCPHHARSTQQSCLAHCPRGLACAQTSTHTTMSMCCPHTTCIQRQAAALQAQTQQHTLPRVCRPDSKSALSGVAYSQPPCHVLLGAAEGVVLAELYQERQGVAGVCLMQQ